ncbi:MAG: 16S rRNA processing protein RimM [Candidatus Eremiobacteraeota bacterium]|nr:16S rRNA processing protein RimM [Candidatus Eremiobacteraeota bacterium]
MKRVAVGRLLGVFGIRGEIKCRPSASGTGAFAAGRLFTLGAEPGARELRCTTARRHHERLLLAFEGISTPEAARDLIGADLYADSAEVELGPNEYLDADLIGLRLISENGRELARVVGVRHFPAQDCLVVDPGGALVPLVKAFVRAIDVAGGTMSVSLPAGLLSDDESGR